EDCSETAHTPRELFEKLAQWGFDTLVIPHGNTWGLYTPPGSSWDKQLVGPEHDPARQTLIEVFSGHGNSEQYRDWHEVTYGPDGAPVCPPPSRDYLPCCWQAGELVRARCDGAAPAECERRVAAARTNYLRAQAAGRMTLPDEPAESWKDCGQCRDCFDPAFNYRPRSSVQYAMALTNFDDPAHPRRFHFGFIASSDNHTARPGTGYKEYGRRMMTEAAGVRDEGYGTSGPRILLWFDLLAPDGVLPMGSETRLAVAPKFRIRAVGSLVQTPGCPEWSTHALGPERLDYLCRGECYNPSDARLR